MGLFRVFLLCWRFLIVHLSIWSFKNMLISWGKWTLTFKHLHVWRWNTCTLWKDLILLGQISYLTQARFKFPTHSPTSLNKCNLFFFLLGGSPTFTLSLLTGWFCATFHTQRMCFLSFSYKKIICFPLSISITVCIVI